VEQRTRPPLNFRGIPADLRRALGLGLGNTSPPLSLVTAQPVVLGLPPSARLRLLGLTVMAEKSDFPVDSSKASGRKSYCISCDRRRGSAYYAAHKDELYAERLAVREAAREAELEALAEEAPTRRRRSAARTGVDEVPPWFLGAAHAILAACAIAVGVVVRGRRRLRRHP